MPVQKVTKVVIEKLIKLCETYESGVIGDQFGWSDLEEVSGLPYQTLCKYREINNAYQRAKNAIRDRRLKGVAQQKTPTLKESEMEALIMKLQAENILLKKQVDAYAQRFSKWMFNAMRKGVDMEGLEAEIPKSLNTAMRERGSLPKSKK